eukprot:6785573-Alexandrium_andersonii.AAC.1
MPPASSISLRSLAPSPRGRASAAVHMGSIGATLHGSSGCSAASDGRSRGRAASRLMERSVAGFASDAAQLGQAAENLCSP